MIELGTDSQLIMKNFSTMCTELSTLCNLVSSNSNLLGNFFESVSKVNVIQQQQQQVVVKGKIYKGWGN